MFTIYSFFFFFGVELCLQQNITYKQKKDFLVNIYNNIKLRNLKYNFYIISNTKEM